MFHYTHPHFTMNSHNKIIILTLSRKLNELSLLGRIMFSQWFICHCLIDVGQKVILNIFIHNKMT